MFFLSVLCILMGNLGISFDKCHYCCIYLCVCVCVVFHYAFYSILCVKDYFNSRDLKSLVISLTSLSKYVKVVQFVVWCLGSVCMLGFCGRGSGFSIRFVLYLLFCSMFLMMIFHLF
jgi:hypothetical protein